MVETTTNKETFGFETEVKQLLQLMIHSLYSNKEIFLRELISNASDAADKIRFLSLDDAKILDKDTELKIFVSADKENNTITISDNGIGMNKDDVIENLGTIAKSGTKAFLQSLTGDQKQDAQMIGQFGVGFYSSFIVSDKVTVITLKAGEDSDNAVKWESAGEGDYTLETVSKASRGTEITLHLKEGETEFVEPWRLRNIITKYSDHINFPVMMPKPAADDKEEQQDDESSPEFEQVNRATALWTCSKNDLSDDEYKEFYRHVSHDFAEPLAWAHNKVEGKLEYTSLLYLPTKAPFDLWMRDAKRGLKLYVQRVFIMDEVEQFLPGYLRFVKGIIDSNDLPLNISREILQSNKAVDSIRSAVTKRVLDMIEKIAKNDPDKYKAFWTEFGSVLKEGPAEDFTNKDKIAKLLRFASTDTDQDEANVSLEDYVARMPEKQKHIYYIAADSFNAAKNSPHLEIFRKQGIEVLLLSERIDEWSVQSLQEFEGKTFQSVAQGALDLDEIEEESVKEEQKKVEEASKGLVERMKEVLGEKVKDVRVTHRLTSSPACIVADDNDMTMQMERILKAAGQTVPASQPIFEVNPNHPLLEKLAVVQDNQKFGDWTHMLFDQALLAEGGQLEDPATFVKRLNEILMEVA